MLHFCAVCFFNFFADIKQFWCSYWMAYLWVFFCRRRSATALTLASGVRAVLIGWELNDFVRPIYFDSRTAVVVALCHDDSLWMPWLLPVSSSSSSSSTAVVVALCHDDSLWMPWLQPVSKLVYFAISRTAVYTTLIQKFLMPQRKIIDAKPLKLLC